MTTKDEALQRALEALDQHGCAWLGHEKPYNEAIAACREALAHDHDDRDRTDAECFRFWVSEAARSPAAMAALITHCITEQEYRDAILQIIVGRKAAIAKATGGDA